MKMDIIRYNLLPNFPTSKLNPKKAAVQRYEHSFIYLYDFLFAYRGFAIFNLILVIYLYTDAKFEINKISQSAETVEYTDCTAVEG